MVPIISKRDSLSITKGNYECAQSGGYKVLRKFSTSSGWSSAFFTTGQCLITSPFGPITTVERIVPSTVLPYIIFLPHAPYFFIASALGSDSKTYGRSYFSENLLCEEILSLLTPKTTAFNFLSWLLRSRNPQASLVQPGVLSLG